MNKIIIICVIIIFGLSIYSEEFYFLNLRQSLNNHSNINLPTIELFLNAKYDSTANIHFYSSFYEFYPYDFILTLDSLRINKNKYSVFIGDKLFHNMDYLKFRGIGYYVFIKNLLFSSSFGQSKNFISSKYPQFDHNKFIFISQLSYSFSGMDSTNIYFIKREDDTLYNKYNEKSYFGFISKFQNKNIRFFSNIKYGNFNNYNNTDYKKISAKYSLNLLYTKFSLNVSGEYIPYDFISITDMLYNTGNFNNNISVAIKVTDELSLYTYYNDVSYLLNPAISYYTLGMRTGIKIPFLPNMNAEINLSKYSDSNETRSFYWRISLYKRFKSFLISSYFLKINQMNFSTSTFNTRFEYTFPNNASSGINLNTNFNHITDYRLSTYIRFKPIKTWNIEFGSDYLFSEDYFYIYEYILNSFNFNNFYLNLIGTLRFKETTYASLSINLSVKNELKDLHLSALDGKIFIDSNNNGVLDKNENGIGNVYIILNDTIKIKSNLNGYFSKYFMKPGIYKIRINAPNLPAYYNISGDYTIELKNIGKKTFNIPIIKMGSINGYVFLDTNKNGIKDKEERGIANILISIKNTNMYTYTNSNGFYMFSNLNKGNYIVEIVRIPTGYTLSIPGIINYVTVKDIKADYTIDFGLIKESKTIIRKIF